MSRDGWQFASTVLTRMGADIATALQTAACFKHTWFTTQFSAEVCQYYKGTLPGDPEVDLLFIAVIREALNEIHQRLA